MINSTDQLNRVITLSEPAKRIVSLVPSQTELLFDLGLDQEVIGITNFCVHPRAKFLEKKRIGGTKNPDLKQIRLMSPDLIIANKEENNASDIFELAKEFPVWVSDVNTLFDALNMMTSIGALVNREAEATLLRDKVHASFKQLPTITNYLKTIYLIWNKPYMAAGTDTFISYLLSCAGFENVISKTRYPELTLEAIKQINPEVLMLSSEPYPFKEKNRKILQDELPTTKVVIVDGELFSWYGSRLQYCHSYFIQLIDEIKSQ